jgi:hypothetical protein
MEENLGKKLRIRESPRAIAALGAAVSRKLSPPP